MNPIIIATDFSEPAANAADYAAQLALQTKSELIMVHVWSLPVMSGETIAFPYSVDELQANYQDRVTKEAEALGTKWNLHVRAVQRMGFLQDELNALCRETKASIIIMGMGQSKREPLLGSSASSFAMHTGISLMIIPREAGFVQIKKILLASDFKTEHHWHEVDKLKEFADSLHASIHVLHVSDDLEAVAAEHRKRAEMLGKRLGTKTAQWHFGSGDVVMKIGEEAEELHANVVAMVHHQLPWYKKLFHISSSKIMTVETHLPLIILPDHA